MAVDEEAVVSTVMNDVWTPEQRETAIQAVINGIQIAETIPEQYVKTRALNIVIALWSAGWRPTK